jgi:hypothetical protein
MPFAQPSLMVTIKQCEARGVGLSSLLRAYVCDYDNHTQTNPHKAHKYKAGWVCMAAHSLYVYTSNVGTRDLHTCIHTCGHLAALMYIYAHAAFVALLRRPQLHRVRVSSKIGVPGTNIQVVPGVYICLYVYVCTVCMHYAHAVFPLCHCAKGCLCGVKRVGEMLQHSLRTPRSASGCR